MPRRYQWFTRRRDGVVTVRLRPDEAALLLQIGGELRTALTEPDDGPVMGRLFPQAYLDPTEEMREREYAALVHADLLRIRLDRVTAMLESVEAVARGNSVRTLELTDEAVHEWMGVLNDARLAIGVAVGMTEDLEPGDVDDDDPRRFGIEVYTLLTWFFSELVDVALGTMPTGGME